MQCSRSILSYHIQISLHLSGRRQSTCHVLKSMKRIRCVFDDNLSHLMTKPTNDCAPSKDSDQPRHPPNLIRVFAVCMKKAWALSYILSAQRTLTRLGACPDWYESSLGAQAILLVWSWGGSFTCFSNNFDWCQFNIWRFLVDFVVLEVKKIRFIRTTWIVQTWLFMEYSEVPRVAMLEGA